MDQNVNSNEASEDDVEGHGLQPNANEPVAVDDDVEGHGLLRNAAIAAALTVGGGVAAASPASAGPVEDAQTLATSSDLATDAADKPGRIGLHAPSTHPGQIVEAGPQYGRVIPNDTQRPLPGVRPEAPYVPGSPYHIPSDPTPPIWESVPVQDGDEVVPPDAIAERP